MTCRTDGCCQGRKPCPTPAVCADDFTAEETFSAFARGLAVIVLGAAGLIAWLVWEVAPVLRFALS
jgi:hypothetical protein